LPIVLAILSIGSLVIGPFLNHAGTNMIASRNYQTIIEETYSAEAGVEQAIWQLCYSTLAEKLQKVGDSTQSGLNIAVNNLYPSVTVKLDSEIITDTSSSNNNGDNGKHKGNQGNGNHYGNDGNSDSSTNSSTISSRTYLIKSVAGGCAVSAAVLISNKTVEVVSWAVDRG
jgi:hypothetical protein